MLDREEVRIKRLARINLSGGLPPSATLFRDLPSFLNGTRTMRGKRIVMILEAMLELERLTSPIPPEEPMIAALEWKRTNPKKFRLHWEVAEREAKIQRELSRYRFTPHVVVAMGGGGQAPSQWHAWWKGDPMWEKHLRMNSSEALEMILKLTEAGDLTRLRRCTQCEKWLIARFQHQRFCSIKCQQKNFTATAEWKEHRRVYMRKYYHLRKQHTRLKIGRRR